MKPALKLPSPLDGRRAELENALQVAIPAGWTKGEKFMPADQPKAIGEVLVGILHLHLRPAQTAYLFREKMKRRDRVGLGKAKKASPTLVYLTGFDLVIEFNWTQWKLLTPEQRIALVDHELCHLAQDDTDVEKGPRWLLRHHDVEEFAEVVRRWGLWLPDLQEFNTAAKRAQVELFPPDRQLAVMP